MWLQYGAHSMQINHFVPNLTPLKTNVRHLTQPPAWHTVPDTINRPKHAWKGDYNTGNTRAQILTRGWSRVIIPELTQSHRPVLCTVHITACDRVWARVIIGQKPQHHRSIIGIVASSSWSTPIKYYQLAMWSTWVEFLLCNVQWVEFSVTRMCRDNHQG